MKPLLARIASLLKGQISKLFQNRMNLLWGGLILFWGILGISLLETKTFPLEQKGMALGLFSQDPSHSYEEDLKEMKKIGVTHVLLVVSGFQKDIYSSEITPQPNRRLREVIRQAHSLQMKIVLFPILHLEVRKGKDWRGVLQPSNLKRWWKSYENFLLYYAKIAQEENVHSLSVGSELLSREKEKDQWLALIQAVRKHYSGRLFYSANWDHFEVPEFWDALDQVGVNFYHELSQSNSPGLSELKQSLDKAKQKLLSWKKRYPGKRLIITEVGYLSVDGTNRVPWNYFLEGKIDLEEQALCYRAFIEIWKNTPELSGAYFWIWWGKGGNEDRSYTPRGKPALDYLRGWYKP